MLLRKTSDNTLIVADKAADKIVSSLAIGECLAVTKRDLRSYGNLKRWQVFCNTIFKNQDTCKTLRQLKTYILIGVGHCETQITPDGDIAYIVKSVDYKTIKKEDEFRRIFSDAIDFAIDKWGMDEQLLQRVLGFS